MILVGTADTLAAVRRSLEAHVLPALDDDFARIQVLAAMRAVDEVHDRLANGDPLARLNAALEESLRGVADRLADSDPAAAALVAPVLDGLPETPEPRDRRRELSARIAELLPTLGEGARVVVLDALQADAVLAAGEDALWACREAIESLQ